MTIPKAPSPLPQKTLPNSRRSGWLKMLHQWHWISSALSLLGILLFSFTGITLNHGAQIESHPTVSRRNAELPAVLLQQAREYENLHDGSTAPLPEPLQHWLLKTLSLRTADKTAEYSAEELYIAMPRPGGDAWLRIDLTSGGVEYELTDRGWIAWLNDLHKGRHTGDVWMWFIDIFALSCLVFSITGLLILKFHATNRPLTWPLVGLGVLIPLLLALLFIH
ncbi:MAG TPA: PepSY-associated TM helix domain-containing protein [Spongiibacteraceae bacterium]|nr:PepSY-associated TM helix domain-containing protein [Spongiibacteraceae bacterium]